MRRLVDLTLLSLTLALASPPGIAQQPAPQAPSANEEAPDTVTVTAKRRKLMELRARMVEVEDRLYARFNEVNKEDQYDIVCRMSAPTGTLIEQRVCKPKLVEQLTSVEAQDFLGKLRGDTGRSTGEPANWIIRSRKAEYTKHVLSVLRSNADLRKLIREREALEKEYDEVQRQAFENR